MTGLGPPRVRSRDAAPGVRAAGQGEESLLKDLEGRVSACSFPVPDLLPGPEEVQLLSQVPGALLIVPGSARLLCDLALIQEIDPGVGLAHHWCSITAQGKQMLGRRHWRWEGAGTDHTAGCTLFTAQPPTGPVRSEVSVPIL